MPITRRKASLDCKQAQSALPVQLAQLDVQHEMQLVRRTQKMYRSLFRKPEASSLHLVIEDLSEPSTSATFFAYVYVIAYLSCLIYFDCVQSLQTPGQGTQVIKHHYVFNPLQAISPAHHLPTSVEE